MTANIPIILILGAMHFLNMFIFFRLRKRAIADRNDPTLRQDPAIHFKA